MRRTLFVPVLAAALTGCSLLGHDTACTQADEDSRVSAVWRPADFGGRDAARIRLCVDDTCEERTSGSPDDPFISLSVKLPDEVGASSVPVRLVVTSEKDGDTIVEDNARTRLTEDHPNGTSCPPPSGRRPSVPTPPRASSRPRGSNSKGESPTRSARPSSATEARMAAPPADSAAHRPPRRRVLQPPGPTPLGGRADDVLAERLSPPAPPLQAQVRPLLAFVGIASALICYRRLS